MLRHARKDGSSSKVWAEALLDRKPFKVVAVALANKSARIAWALLTRGETFDGARALARLTDKATKRRSRKRNWQVLAT